MQRKRGRASAETPTASRSSREGWQIPRRCPSCPRWPWLTPSSTAFRRWRMDAREALRRYLEQRRELGESEMVLDALSVEDAMKLLGAGAAAAGTGTGTGTRNALS